MSKRFCVQVVLLDETNNVAGPIDLVEREKISFPRTPTQGLQHGSAVNRHSVLRERVLESWTGHNWLSNPSGRISFD